MRRDNLGHRFLQHETPGPITRSALFIGKKVFDAEIIERGHVSRRFIKANSLTRMRHQDNACRVRTSGVRALRGNLATLNAMARLHEYQGKAILAANGFKVPRGRAVLNPDDAVTAAKELGCEVVVKIQAWITGRAGI